MYKYHCLNPIADIGLNNFTEDYTKIDTDKGADALLVRSAVMHDMEFDKNLKAIGRAGAGVNNIPLDTCAEQGNSRYVAQRFAAALGDDLITANEYIKNDTPADLHSDRPWVFVSPTYGWQIPRIFADFLRRGRFTGSRKAYFVMTCGSEIGNAGSRIAALCADIGLDYQGVLQVVMPENYVAMFYVPGAEESAQIIAAAQPSIDGGIACVQRGEPFPAPKVGLLDRFKTGPVNTIFYRWFVKSGPFTVSDACIGCGKCALSCPVNGIDIVERRPHWNGACTHCMACICGCPVSAIEYGHKSQGKPRYQCPEYK